MRQSCRRSLLADQKENGEKAGFGFRRLRFPFRAPDGRVKKADRNVRPK